MYLCIGNSICIILPVYTGTHAEHETLEPVWCWTQPLHPSEQVKSNQMNCQASWVLFMKQTHFSRQAVWTCKLQYTTVAMAYGILLDQTDKAHVNTEFSQKSLTHADILEREFPGNMSAVFHGTHNAHHTTPPPPPLVLPCHLPFIVDD